MYWDMMANVGEWESRLTVFYCSSFNLTSLLALGRLNLARQVKTSVPELDSQNCASE